MSFDMQGNLFGGCQSVSFGHHSKEHENYYKIELKTPL